MADNPEDNLTLGIEEEYLLVDPASRDLARDPPESFMAQCKEALGDHVTPEFLRSQVEIGTPVCQNIKEARRELKRLRRDVATVAEAHGMRIMAASTHPFAHWGRQLHTKSERYDVLARDFQGAIRRMLICGMHVHVGIEDPDLRIDVMNQIRYFIPHLLALSTSSPFWESHRMGVMSFRLSVFDGMPRTGIPDEFAAWGDYDRVISRMVEVGVMEDASKIWWDIRPSAKFPTLEMRVTDVCPLIEDAIAIAALYQCLVRMFIRVRDSNLRWRIYPRVLVHENRWLAQRYGCKGRLIDLGKGKLVPFSELLEEIMGLIAEDADALDCREEIAHAHTILERGTSAVRQLDLFNRAIANGISEHLAFHEVVDQVLEESVSGLDD